MKKHKSIITDDWEHCYLCDASSGLEEHHIMHGTANRKLADKYRLTVPLCPECHRNGKHSVEKDKKVNTYLIEIAQRLFESEYSHELWMKVFMKNYL